jgi:outer membrane lipoprotein-sorting protein
MKERKLTALMSYIADFESKNGIELDHFRKTYKKISIDERIVMQFTKSNPIEQFRSIKADNAERIGEESQDGRKIDVYLVKKVNLMGIEAELSGSEGDKITVWVDRGTSLPVRILLQTSFRVEGKSEDSIEFCDFAWNEPLDQALFDLNPPEGYTLSTGPDFPTE